MTKLVGLLAAIGMTSVALPVFAQEAPGRGGLDIAASGRVLYDSNQLRVPDGGSAGPGVAKDDIRYSPALTATYVRATGRATLIANATAGRDFYQNNSYLNRNHFAGGGSLGYSAGGRCSALLDGNYSSRQNGINDFNNADTVGPQPGDLPPDDVGRLIDNRQTYATYGLSANCSAPGGRLSFGAAAHHSGLSNAAPTRRFADSNSNSYSGFVGIGVFRPGQLQVTGSYSTIDYPNELTIPGVAVPVPFRNGVKTYRFGLAYSRPIGTKFSGTIGLSYLAARPDGGQSPYTSPAYNVSVTYTPSNRLTFGLSGSRDVLASSTAGALFRVVDVVDLTASYKLGLALSARVNAGLTANNYRQSFATVDERVPRGNDTSKNFGLGLIYAPRRLYDISANVSETLRSSNPALYSYSSTRVSLTLAVHI